MPEEASRSTTEEDALNEKFSHAMLLGFLPDDRALYSCNECGALVFPECFRKHADWHTWMSRRVLAGLF